MYRNTKTILASLVFVFGLFSVPNFALAAYTDVTMTNDVVITVGSTTLNITGSSTTIDTITVNANSFSFSMSPLSFIQVTSQARHTLNSDANAIYIGNNICTATESTIGFYNAAPTYSPTVTVTPATTTCTLTPEVLGGNGVGADAPYVAPAYASGGGGGGGGSSYITPAQTVTQTNTTPTPAVTTQTTQTEEISTKDDSVYYRKLSLGSKGEDVTALQIFLEKKGYLKKGLPKGYFGASTKTALIKYQKSIKLTPSGLFGPETRAAVEKSSSAKVPTKTTTTAKTTTTTTAKTSVATKSTTSNLSVGSKGTEVTELQTFLEDKGFLKKGLPKGYFGASTKAALIKYQKSVGITANGIYGSITKAKIKDRNSSPDVVEKSTIDIPKTVKKTPAAIPVVTKPTSTTSTGFKTNLSLGASGSAVTEMQTFLEQKGFLPKGQPKGQFGLLTKTALMKYQKSVGLNPSGIFGPDTRAYINSHN